MQWEIIFFEKNKNNCECIIEILVKCERRKAQKERQLSINSGMGSGVREWEREARVSMAIIHLRFPMKIDIMKIYVSNWNHLVKCLYVADFFMYICPHVLFLKTNSFIQVKQQQQKKQQQQATRRETRRRKKKWEFL